MVTNPFSVLGPAVLFAKAERGACNHREIHALQLQALLHLKMSQEPRWVLQSWAIPVGCTICAVPVDEDGITVIVAMLTPWY